MQMLRPLAPHGLETSRGRDNRHTVYSLSLSYDATQHGINLLHTLQQITALINMCGKLSLLLLLQQVSSKEQEKLRHHAPASGGVTCPGKTSTTTTTSRMDLHSGTGLPLALSLIPNKSVICN